MIEGIESRLEAKINLPHFFVFFCALQFEALDSGAIFSHTAVISQRKPISLPHA